MHLLKTREVGGETDSAVRLSILGQGVLGIVQGIEVDGGYRSKYPRGLRWIREQLAGGRSKQKGSTRRTIKVEEGERGIRHRCRR